MCRTTICAFAFAALTAAAQSIPQQEFQPLVAWIAEGDAGATIEDHVLNLRRGVIRTGRLYSDFVLRFETRRLDPATEGYLMVRARFGYGDSPTHARGYRIPVTGKRPLGRVTSIAREGMEEVFFNASPVVAEAEWQQWEVRAVRDTLTVHANGRLVNELGALTEFTGYIAFLSSRGAGVEHRNVVVQRIPPGRKPFGLDAHRSSDPGVQVPREVVQSKPFYPREPHDARVQGTVSLELVVEADGTVGDVRVLKSVHPDLDEAAIASARGWRFRPGTKDGQPAAVVITMDVTFRRTD